MTPEERIDKAIALDDLKMRARLVDVVRQAEAAASMHTLREVLLAVNGIEESATYKDTFWSGIMYTRARITALLNESYKGDLTQPREEFKGGLLPSIVLVSGGDDSRDYFREYDPLLDGNAS